MHLLITIPNCSERAKSKGTNGDAEQKSFLHSSHRVTENEAKACSVFVWACKEETAAPSDNPGQGGTATQMHFHPFQSYSKKKIGLFTESAAQLHPAFLLDTCCFGKLIRQLLKNRSFRKGPALPKACLANGSVWPLHAGWKFPSPFPQLP